MIRRDRCIVVFLATLPPGIILSIPAHSPGREGYADMPKAMWELILKEEMMQNPPIAYASFEERVGK